MIWPVKPAPVPKDSLNIFNATPQKTTNSKLETFELETPSP